MKKVAILAVSLWILSLTACDQDIDLTADWQNIPVVYGLLNKADTAHYIRVEKAFQDQNGSAFLAALEPDSIYYSDATVSLLNLTTGKSAILQKVDGALDGYPRDAGDFAQLPNYLYKVKSNALPLSGGDVVRFTLDRGEGLDKVTSECTVLDDIVPQGGLATGSKLDFPSDHDVTFRWRAGDEALIFDLMLRIHYEEKLAGDPNVHTYELEWNMAKGVTRSGGSSTISTKVFGLQFYNFLAENIEARPDATRLLTSMDLVFKGGGEAVAEYISIALANTGITSAQEIPVYSNLSEGRGIFTSVVETTVPGLLLTADSENYLQNAEVTKDLNFQ
ncbi:MAG: DUF4249 family protein [Saprospirales bacterium]|nr:DUF4249 family protein [Saprospirales bacterium]MBK8492315.1 DUF4249 family protein [Saprospirales bacterium]